MKRLLIAALFVGSISAMNTDSGSIGSQSDSTWQSSVYDLISNWDSYTIDYSGPDTSSSFDTTTTSTTDTSTTSTQDSNK